MMAYEDCFLSEFNHFLYVERIQIELEPHKYLNNELIVTGLLKIDLNEICDDIGNYFLSDVYHIW